MNDKDTTGTEYLMIKIDPETKRMLREIAMKHDSDMSKVVRNMIRSVYNQPSIVPQSVVEVSHD